eukprot:CAMPEP_0113297490 /NCGR_PEP_ID=MMETSP0010_2-20120614/328_1 /TAXON_ID=216773 ORGANISM="Corethron hystrix, Strain 308" /NCGR_SAMPLE_ID=MMETSP0010_2 /ASSEMBLY_ACC=CAM_ASM_000155 /LENGTH=240 /DNA_ID=CAMNT_0000150383 /DNA_START=177 /DNA_END=899 /DNA_ORIENTATION=+ /assembly_acc=CAM_ASM_000155
MLGFFCVDGYSLQPNQRRQCLRRVAACVAGICTTDQISNFGAMKDNNKIAQAACLPGDLSKECIGVYKVPLSDAVESEWLTNKETLYTYAPDIRYIDVQKQVKQPETIAEAKKQLKSERVKIKFIREYVLDGELEEAGLLILSLIPTVTSAALKIQNYVEDKTSEEYQAQKELRKFQTSYEILLAEWSGIDIELGMAIRGQRGVTAVAQIEVLEYLKEATVALDDFIKLAELNVQRVSLG